MLAPLLLTAHLLLGVALLGAVTHQVVGLLRPSVVRGGRFITRYAKADRTAFTTAIAVLFASSVLLGGVLYPTYRMHARIAFEAASLGWAIGLFELKEHFGGLGIGLIPAKQLQLCEGGQRPIAAAADAQASRPRLGSRPVGRLVHQPANDQPTVIDDARGPAVAPGATDARRERQDGGAGGLPSALSLGWPRAKKNEVGKAI
jgi:hypothetical protein